MSAPTNTQVSSTSHSKKHGRKNRGSRRQIEETKDDATPPVEISRSPANLESDDVAAEAVCWICVEPVKFYSLSACNHRTCHVCALRLRALYKRMDCTFCKHPQAKLIFTHSPDELFETFSLERTPFKDAKLSIYFETQDIMEETLILLRFNCPDPTCDFVAAGWGDLKMHARAIHSRLLCDLCVRFKKIFAHEHVLYQPLQLSRHLPSTFLRASYKDQGSETPEGGVHPVCEFCRECYFGDDELFAHMRERHEECYLCKREGIKDQYFLNYAGLERHFNGRHFPCKDARCQAQKFVVFGSALDLQAHMVGEHGGNMSSRDKKDARRIEATFEYDDGGGDDGRRRGRNRPSDREREQPEPGPSRSRRREGFGATLTDNAASISPQPRRSEDEQNTIVVDLLPPEYTEFIARVYSLTSNSTTAVSAIKSAMQSYKSSESGPRDLITTMFTVVNQDLSSTASLITPLVELLDEEKRRALLATWNGFKIELQGQFPDLTPSAPGTEYATVAGGRVLKVKHSAAIRSASNQSARQVWDRVAQAAASTSGQQPPPASRSSGLPERFPSLAASRGLGAVRNAQHNTPWSAAGTLSTPKAAQPVVTTQRPVAPTPARSAGPPSMSTAVFPTLPSSGQSHPRPVVSGNQTLKYIIGDTGAPANSAWSGKKGGGGISPTQAAADSTADGDGTGNRKKKKGKEKQMLFTLGTFPT